MSNKITKINLNGTEYNIDVSDDKKATKILSEDGSKLATVNAIQKPDGETNLFTDTNKINDVPYEDALKYLKELPNFHTFQWRFIVKRSLLEKCSGKKELKVADGILKNRYTTNIPLFSFLVLINDRFVQL